MIGMFCSIDNVDDVFEIVSEPVVCDVVNVEVVLRNLRLDKCRIINVKDIDMVSHNKNDVFRG